MKFSAKIVATVVFIITLFVFLDLRLRRFAAQEEAITLACYKSFRVPEVATIEWCRESRSSLASLKKEMALWPRYSEEYREADKHHDLIVKKLREKEGQCIRFEHGDPQDRT